MTGLADSSRSHTVCRAPSNSASCSTIQGTSSMTAIDGASLGSAATKVRSAWFQSSGRVPATSPPSGSDDCAIAVVKSARSAAGPRPRVAWKIT